MKVIIAGSRSITDEKILFRALEQCGFDITEVVCGLARGADALGRCHAICSDLGLKEFPADWKKYGRRAGYIRNEEMAQYADALLALWDGSSPGTKHMIEQAKKYKLKVFVYNINENN